MPANAVEVAPTTTADFKSLEEKILRTIELLKSAREGRAVAERDVTRLREQLNEREEEVESEIKPRNPDARDARIDEFLASSGPTIREGAGEAYYRPGDDFISLPRFEAFKSAAHFYGVAFHELGHWTGHRSRLDRDLRHRFGERAYAAEELVAELCALCRILG